MDMDDLELERRVHAALASWRQRVAIVASNFQERLHSRLTHSTVADRAQAPDAWGVVRDGLSEMYAMAQSAIGLQPVGGREPSRAPVAADPDADKKP